MSHIACLPEEIPIETITKIGFVLALTTVLMLGGCASTSTTPYPPHANVAVNDTAPDGSRGTVPTELAE